MSMQKPGTADRTMPGAAVIARNPRSQIEEEDSLLALEARYCAHGDSMHNAEPPKIFDPCEGSYLYDKRRYAIVGDVDGLGLALRMEICAEDGFTPDKAMVERMAEEGLKGDLEAEGKHHGLVLDVGGHDRNVITLAPALTISHDEIGLALKLLDRLLHRVTRR